MKIKSIYEAYPVYQMLFGRDKDYKAFEAMNCVIAASDFLNTQRKQGAKKQQLRILELFSGISEHKDLFNTFTPDKVEWYKTVDSCRSLCDGKNVLFGDAHKVADTISTLFGFKKPNFAVAHHYSFSSCFNKNNLPSRPLIVRHLKEMVQLLSDGQRGAYYIQRTTADSSIHQDLVDNLSQVLDSGERVVPVWPKHPLRKWLRNKGYKVTDYEDLLVRTHLSTTYDRSWSCTETLFNSIYIERGDGKTVLSISVEDPIVLRGWSEEEMRDMLREAGFSYVVGYHNRFGSDNYVRRGLENYLTVDELPDIDTTNRTEVENYFCEYQATELLAYT